MVAVFPINNDVIITKAAPNNVKEICKEGLKIIKTILALGVWNGKSIYVAQILSLLIIKYLIYMHKITP